ncbi:hypothetical protein O1611_g9315 [Lasiodiplodia mahajangana]|uniref:Uncharacterized protein n=1 Tax=Lasiodiplodia mahajangana TaxID=1108764 RepID=A0ACC2J9Z5_9PEZI|nr:hypothetical protein O1611_g9315 [Lasiodiplodia mahajangana]
MNPRGFDAFMGNDEDSLPYEYSGIYAMTTEFAPTSLHGQQTQLDFIDPELLGPSPEAPIAQSEESKRPRQIPPLKSPQAAQQHFDIGQHPPRCFCGKQFTRSFTLNRHIQESVGNGEFPCTTCTAYQGKDAFKRKRDLQKHIERVHACDRAELEAMFPPRETEMFAIPVCHFPDCEYSRASDFKKLPPKEQEKNRPFHQRSDYPKHMRDEHNWSPFNCNATDCPRHGKKGFFSQVAFEKHYGEKHPGVTIPRFNACRCIGTEKCIAMDMLNAAAARSAYNLRISRGTNGGVLELQALLTG